VPAGRSRAVASGASRPPVQKAKGLSLWLASSWRRLSAEREGEGGREREREPQAAPSLGQPRPISHMGRGTPRPHRTTTQATPYYYPGHTVLLLLRPHRTTTQATLCCYYCPGHTVLLLPRPHCATTTQATLCYYYSGHTMLLLLARPHCATTTQATLCYYYCPGHTMRMEGLWRTMATQKPHAMERPIRRSARLLKPTTSARSNLEAGDSKRSA